MDNPSEHMAAWLRERGFTFDGNLNWWEYEMPEGGQPIRISEEAVAAVSSDIVPTIKQEIERALADAGAGR